jgi:limonene-1,2-epoxide hydrolase
MCKQRGGQSPQGALALLAVAAAVGLAGVGVQAGLADGAARANPKSQVIADTRRFTRIPRQTLAMIERGEAAFLARDPAALAPTLSEDYSWWVVGESGAVPMIRGRDATVKMLGGFFDATQWFDSKVYRLGLVGNLLVQVEVDTVGSPNGPVTKTSLEIYEFRNGERWREWRFSPLNSPFDGRPEAR